MYIALLGRQPKLGLAELEAVYGANAVSPFGEHAALVDAPMFELSRLGGTLKAGRIVMRENGNWLAVSRKIIHHYQKHWAGFEGKLTLGVSAYGFDVPARDVQKTGIILKQTLKKSNVSLRLIPNDSVALSTATSHHNKLGLSDNKIELFIIRNGSQVVVAESIGAQNITAYARRDQGRPKRDAFVGMLPPKLAQIMINLAGPDSSARILDPFCGTGVVLQEAALLDHAVYGTDLAEKMVRYSHDNLEWLHDSHHISFDWNVQEGDAMTATWQQPIGAVVCETYLGQPFSAPPSPAKLADVRKNCNYIISTFLKNIGTQITTGTPLCVAVPAWRDVSGYFTHLPFIAKLDELGYETVSFKNVTAQDLLYYRDDQIVARELLVIRKK